MGDNFLKTIVDTRPSTYQTPPFPSLYWPFPINGGQDFYLYDATDMLLFTLYWTLIFVVGIHMIVAGHILTVQYKNWKFNWVVPLVYLFIGGIEALIAGSAIGGLLGGVYTSGYFRMSTWIPFTWGLINALSLILSSFAIQGGL